MHKDKNVVLIADDDSLFRRLIRDCVGEYANVVEAKTGAEFFDAYEKNNPDMVFLDLHMPDADGKDLLGDIMKKDPGAYVVMVSADSLQENVLSAKACGAKGFVSKPFRRETVLRYLLACPGIDFHDTCR